MIYKTVYTNFLDLLHLTGNTQTFLLKTAHKKASLF